MRTRSSDLPKAALICIVFVCGCWLLFLPSSSSSATYFVNPDGSGQATTIQAAIDNALEGDTIIVEPGRYRERFIIKRKKGISLKPLLESGEKLIEIHGQGGSKGLIEIIDSDAITLQGLTVGGGKNPASNLIYISSSSVLIEGNRIEQARSAGVYITGKSNVELVRNRISANYTGLLFYGSTGKVLYNEIFNNSKNGIHITKKSNVAVNHNTFYRNKGTALLVEWGSTAEAFNNIFAANGIGVRSSEKISADYNLFHKNRKSSRGISKSSHNMFEDPQFQDPAKDDFSLQAGSPALQAASDGLDLGSAMLRQ
jgi:parallel beta-helix repeat protein